ncbi:hypothetical protein IAT40_006071 [Kwoniella sp. CBS 6097]
MRSTITLFCAIYLVLLSMTMALPIALWSRSLLDHTLSHSNKLNGSTRDNLKSHLLYYTSANQSEVDISRGSGKIIECGTTSTDAPGLLVQTQAQERSSHKELSDKEAWEAASWIWG